MRMRATDRSSSLRVGGETNGHDEQRIRQLLQQTQPSQTLLYVAEPSRETANTDGPGSEREQTTGNLLREERDY